MIVVYQLFFVWEHKDLQIYFTHENKKDIILWKLSILIPKEVIIIHLISFGLPVSY